MHRSVCIVRVSENIWWLTGIDGKGFSCDELTTAASDGRRGFVMFNRGCDRATRRRILGRKVVSASSLEGVSGGVGGSVVWSVMMV